MFYIGPSYCVSHFEGSEDSDGVHLSVSISSVKAAVHFVASPCTIVLVCYFGISFLQVCLDCTSEDFAQYRAQVSWQHEQHASAAKAKGLRQACADPLLQEGAMAGFRKQQRVLEQALGEANAKAARNAKRYFNIVNVP